MRSPAFAIDTAAGPSLSVNLDWEPDSVIVSNPTAQSILINVGSNAIPTSFTGAQLFCGPLSISTLPVTGASFGVAFYPAISAQGLTNPPTKATLTFTAGVTTPQYGALPVTSIQVQQIAGTVSVSGTVAISGNVSIVEASGTQNIIGAIANLTGPNTITYTLPTSGSPGQVVALDWFSVALPPTTAAGDVGAWIQINTSAPIFRLWNFNSMTTQYLTGGGPLGGVTFPVGTPISAVLQNSSTTTYSVPITLIGRIVTP